MSPTEEIEDDGAIEISWLEIFLALAGLTLAFQLWPNVFFKTGDLVYDTLDLTRWGWRSYLVANVLAFVALATIRLRQGRA